ncbi:MAG TPA: helix-turn-helix domain-containing protein [Propionibacteriaceae bacterium]|nr:helix-turn-helix domain-containing protein [Propionibacteriaceae bacterium]
MSKQTATALVDRLEAAGYVERVVDPSDARAVSFGSPLEAKD